MHEEYVETDYALKIGDVVLIQHGGYGFLEKDVGKYVEVVGYGDYYGEAGVKVVPYDKPFETVGYGNEQGVVGYGSFGKNPMILMNIHDEHVVDNATSSKKDMVNKPSPLEVQFGGSHYKNKEIQPIEYILANNLQFCEGNIVKYITRWKDKGGVEDLEKIKHYCDFLIQKEKGQLDGKSS